MRARVVAYVRPQIEWFNSAWWQWWTWRDEFDTPADLLRQWRGGWRPGFMRWRTQLAPWLVNPSVDGLTVRLYRRDTLPDFLELLGAAGTGAGARPGREPLAGARAHQNPEVRARTCASSTRPSSTGCCRRSCRRPNRRRGCSRRTICGRSWTAAARTTSSFCRCWPRRTPHRCAATRGGWSITPYLDRPLAQPADLEATPRDLQKAIEALLRALT